MFPPRSPPRSAALRLGVGPSPGCGDARARIPGFARDWFSPKTTETLQKPSRNPSGSVFGGFREGFGRGSVALEENQSLPEIRALQFFRCAVPGSPRRSRQLPQGRFFVLGRFLTVPGPGNGLRRPKTQKSRPLYSLSRRLDLRVPTPEKDESRPDTSNLDPRTSSPPPPLPPPPAPSSQRSDASGRCFAIFGLRRPFLGPRTVKQVF